MKAMSFYDGRSIASIFDVIEMRDIVKLLRDHDIYVEESIINNREYLYYFIGNCNVVQQNAIRDDGAWRFHRMQDLCAKLSTSLLLFVLRTCSPDVVLATYHSRKELLSQLNDFDLLNLIRERGWNTDHPTFIDATFVATTVHVHHKEAIVDTLRSVCPTGFIPSELLRETRMTVYMFC
ncbi:hypothetical protein F5146DRAFT_1120969, partial [Armillaria mellea]